MHVEVDQSGKVENTRVDTVLAFSNGMNHAILVSAKVKRIVTKQLRGRGKPKRGITLLLFSACLFLLLRDYLEQIERVTIDVEYLGKDADIRGNLLYHVHRHGLTLHKDQIAFRQLGKQSPAHTQALAIYRGEYKPNRRITTDELLELLGFIQ
jgi:hypothetical protein